VPWLLDTYGGARPRVLQAVIAHALSIGARSAVVEYRYLDPDWRNEHREFYASTFRRYPSITHRLHFFAESPDPLFLDPECPARFDDLTYLGYCVLRPVPAAPVGRTMLRAQYPNDLTCMTKDKVNLFGKELEIEGTPFAAQDAQLSRCAQTTTWITAYYHHLRFGGPRILPGEIAKAVADDLVVGRQLPSPGLTIGQMADAARSIGLPPLVYPLRHLAHDESVPRMLCRYLNSGIPVTVATRSHAFVLIGYKRSHSRDGKELLHFVRHDDEVGPYRYVDWKLDVYGPWEYAIVPLPPKVYLPGEDAEAIGAARIRDELDRTPTEAAASLLRRIEDPDRPLSFRSTVVLSNEFKSTLGERRYTDDVAAAYQRMQLSRFVWVVELTDRRLRDAGEPCVLAEAIIDATDHVRDLHVLGWRVPGAVWGWLPDDGVHTVRRRLGPAEPTISIAQPRVMV
jgi:hypothetical protein